MTFPNNSSWTYDYYYSLLVTVTIMKAVKSNRFIQQYRNKRKHGMYSCIFCFKIFAYDVIIVRFNFVTNRGVRHTYLKIHRRTNQEIIKS